MVAFEHASTGIALTAAPGTADGECQINVALIFGQKIEYQEMVLGFDGPGAVV